MLELKRSWKEYIEPFLKESQQKYNLPREVVEEIITSQFRFAKSVIEEGKFYSVKLPFLCNFSVSMGSIFQRLKKKEISIELAREHLVVIKKHKKKPTKILSFFIHSIELEIQRQLDANKQEENKQPC